MLGLINQYISRNCLFLAIDDYPSYRGLADIGYNHEVVCHN